MYVEDVEDAYKCVQILQQVHGRGLPSPEKPFGFQLTIIFKHEMIGILPNIHNNFELSGTSN